MMEGKLYNPYKVGDKFQFENVHAAQKKSFNEIRILKTIKVLLKN